MHPMVLTYSVDFGLFFYGLPLAEFPLAANITSPPRGQYHVYPGANKTEWYG